MLEHEDSRHSLDWLGSLGSLDSSTDQREVLVQVVVAVDKVDCSTVTTADRSKEIAVVVVVVVVVETGGDSKVLDLKLVQTCWEGHNIAKVHVPGVEVRLLQLVLHSPSRTAKCQLSDQLPQYHLLLLTYRCAVPIR